MTIDTPIEIVEDEVPTLSTLMSDYNKVKKSNTEASSRLTSDFTLKGMDEVNQMVSDAMLKIDDFVANGAKEGAIKTAASKALAVIDPKSKWAGKWLNSASTAVREEELSNKTIDEIVIELTANIEKKREEVITAVEQAVVVRTSMVESIQLYKVLQTKAEQALQQTSENTRASFDAKYLITMLIGSIENLETDIKSHVDPLIAAANISVTQIQAILPTIENDLQSKLGFKAVQQKLADLNQMTKEVSNLASIVGDTLRKSINETTYESIALLSETGLDTDKMEKVAAAEIEHQKKLNVLMLKTQANVSDTFEKVKQHQINSNEQRQANTNLLIEAYAES